MRARPASPRKGRRPPASRANASGEVGLAAPGAVTELGRRPGEREAQRRARGGRDRPQRVLLRCVQLELRLEDAGRVGADLGDGPPVTVLTSATLDRDDALVARRVPPPDGDDATAEV